MKSLKCINCLSRFVRKSKTTYKDITIEEHRMATWDDNYWYGGSIDDLGLKTCPFDARHKIKASHYSKHVTKCEQQFPKNRCSTSNLNSNQFTSIDSCFDTQFDDNSETNYMTKSMTQLNQMPIEDWTYAYGDMPAMEASTSVALTRSLSPDSAIGLNNNSSIETKTEVHTNEDISTSFQTLALNDSQNRTDDSEQNEESVASVETPLTLRQMVPIVPAITIRESQPSNCDNSSKDPDDWNSGQPYSLYEGYENMDDLTDDQIMEMADSFIDTVILAKMTKKQRKVLKDKIIKLKKAEKDLKMKAFNELVTFTDIWDPDLKEIPQEIRKPRVDIRELFKLNKKEDNPIKALKRSTPVSPEPKECPPNPWSPDILFSSEGPSGSQKSSVDPSVDSLSSKSSQISTEVVLNTVCNSCWHSIDLNKENIKRMTVFCAKCSGIKFGGYFECQSCKLYGYFANSQISQHLTKHFPENK